MSLLSQGESRAPSMQSIHLLGPLDFLHPCNISPHIPLRLLRPRKSVAAGRFNPNWEVLVYPRLPGPGRGPTPSVARTVTGAEVIATLDELYDRFVQVCSMASPRHVLDWLASFLDVNFFGQQLGEMRQRNQY